jgi:hypothetical protein
VAIHTQISSKGSTLIFLHLSTLTIQTEVISYHSFLVSFDRRRHWIPFAKLATVCGAFGMKTEEKFFIKSKVKAWHENTVIFSDYYSMHAKVEKMLSSVLSSIQHSKYQGRHQLD